MTTLEPAEPLQRRAEFYFRRTAKGLKYARDLASGRLRIEAAGHVVVMGVRKGPMGEQRTAEQVAKKLAIRGAAIEKAKELVGSEENRRTLDRLLARWFKYPGTWKSSRRFMVEVITAMGLSKRVAAQVKAIFNEPELKGTWAQ